MSSSDAAGIDVSDEPLKQTKREGSKEPQALAKEATSLKYRAWLQKDVTTRMEEQSSTFLQTVSLLEEGFHLMEKDIVAAMATFRHRLEQFKVNLARHNDERDARDVLLQDIGAQVKEVKDLKTREALPERIEGDRGKPPKTSEAKGGGEHRDPGDAKRRNESSTLTALQLCEEVKRRKAEDLEEEGLSNGETVKSLAALKRLAPNQRASHSAEEPVRTKRRSAAWRSARACHGGHAHSGRSTAWQSVRVCRGGHAHPANSSHNRLAGALA